MFVHVHSISMVFSTAVAAHEDVARASVHGYNYQKRTVGPGLPVLGLGRTVTMLNAQSKDTVGSRTSSQLLITLRGGSTSTSNEQGSDAPLNASSSSSSRDLAVFLSSYFLIVQSLALVAFSPENY